MALPGMVLLIQRTIDWQRALCTAQPQVFRALTPLVFGHINPLRSVWSGFGGPVVPGKDV